MRHIYQFIFFFVLVLFCSCSEHSTKFGTVTYYPKFLWVDAKTVPAEKVFEFDFSQDAKNDKGCFAEFLFVDNDDKPIDTNEMQVYADGKPLSKNKLRVNSSVCSQKVSFVFNPEAKGGKHQGYLRLINYKLDRLDSETLKPGQRLNVFQWTLDYDKQMNPLAKVLMWILIVFCSVLLIWFVVLKPLKYPRFGKFTKSMLLEKDGKLVGQMNVVFKGARRVVFSDRKIKQSFWNRLFTGEVRTYVNPLFVGKLTFIPKKKNAICFGEGYNINPNPIPRSGIANIDNRQQKIKITIR